MFKLFASDKCKFEVWNRIDQLMTLTRSPWIKGQSDGTTPLKKPESMGQIEVELLKSLNQCAKKGFLEKECPLSDLESLKKIRTYFGDKNINLMQAMLFLGVDKSLIESGLLNKRFALNGQVPLLEKGSAYLTAALTNPLHIVLDEFFSYTSEGLETIMAQARSGFSSMRKHNTSMTVVTQVMEDIFNEVMPIDKTEKHFGWYDLMVSIGEQFAPEGQPGLFCKCSSRSNMEVLLTRAKACAVLLNTMQAEDPNVRPLLKEWAADRAWRSGDLAKLTWVCASILLGHSEIEAAAELKVQEIQLNPSATWNSDRSAHIQFFELTRLEAVVGVSKGGKGHPLRL